MLHHVRGRKLYYNVNNFKLKSVCTHVELGRVQLIPPSSFSFTFTQSLNLLAMSRFLSSFINSFSRCATSSSRASLEITVTRQQGSEPPSRYEVGGYHPVNIGEVFNQRYKIVRKLGWGLYSTVWLVQDTRFVLIFFQILYHLLHRNQGLTAMKILIGDLFVEKEAWDELGILRILRDGNPESLGYRLISQLKESFVHKGPNGDHICLVMEPLGLSLLDIYRGFLDAMPLILVKRIATHVLQALRYIQEECGVIHTGWTFHQISEFPLFKVLLDIQGDNILISGSPPGPGQATIQISMHDLMSSTFKLTDFGAGTPNLS